MKEENHGCEICRVSYEAVHDMGSFEHGRPAHRHSVNVCVFLHTSARFQIPDSSTHHQIQWTFSVTIVAQLFSGFEHSRCCPTISRWERVRARKEASATSTSLLQRRSFHQRTCQCASTMSSLHRPCQWTESAFNNTGIMTTPVMP